jgi:hypothetical protein
MSCSFDNDICKPNLVMGKKTKQTLWYIEPYPGRNQFYSILRFKLIKIIQLCFLLLRNS